METKDRLYHKTCVNCTVETEYRAVPRNKRLFSLLIQSYKEAGQGAKFSYVRQTLIHTQRVLDLQFKLISHLQHANYLK